MNMKYSIKDLLLITAMLPVSVGWMAAISECAATIADWFYYGLFPKADNSWDKAFCFYLRNIFETNGSRTRNAFIGMAPFALFGIAVACMNVLLVWTRHKNFVLFSAVSIFMMPICCTISLYMSPGFVYIFGAGETCFVGAIIGIIGSAISATAVGAFMFYRSRTSYPETMQPKKEQKKLNPRVVVVIYCWIVLTSMYGWWLLNA